MEAPEIIWLSPNEYRSNEPSCFWSESQRTDYDIKYICKDAFIEKVVNFLEVLGYAYTITDNITKSLYDNTQLIEDFKKYMEE